MQLVGEIDFLGQSKEQIIETILDMNKNALKKNGELLQTLFFKKDSDKWYIAFVENESQETKDKFWSDILHSVPHEIKSIVLVSDMTLTDLEANKKKDALMLHYLDDKGTVIVKQASYVKKFLKGIVYENVADRDPSVLFHYLEPIAETYRVRS